MTFINDPTTYTGVNVYLSEKNGNTIELCK